MCKHVILIGMSGVGKTHLSRHIANHLDMEFYDTDAIIESLYKYSVSELVKKHSWAWFRNTELNVLENLLLTLSHKSIISTGGGIIENARIEKLFEGHCVIYLKRTVSESIKNSRCLLKSYDELHAERMPVYEGLATHTFINNGSADDFLIFIEGLEL